MQLVVVVVHAKAASVLQLRPSTCSANFRQPGPRSLGECLSWPATAVALGKACSTLDKVHGQLESPLSTIDGLSHTFYTCHCPFEGMPSISSPQEFRIRRQRRQELRHSAPCRTFPNPTSQRFLWGAMSSLRGLWGGHQGAEHSGHMGNDQFNNLCLDPTWNQTPAPHPSHPLTTHPFTARAWHPRHNRSVQ